MKGVKTLNGINKMFCYIVYPSGEVLFRKFPCFCDDCCNMNFKSCKFKALCGLPKVVVKSGQVIRKSIIPDDSE